MPSYALARLLRLHVALGSFPLQEVIETRVTLERSIVVLACSNAQPKNFERMRSALLAMDEPEVTRGTFNQLDIDFHVALADAGGNRLMSDVTRAIRESVRVPFLAAAKAMPKTGERGWPRTLDGLRSDHHGLFAAVEAGHSEQAADLVESHLRRFYCHPASAACGFLTTTARPGVPGSPPPGPGPPPRPGHPPMPKTTGKEGLPARQIRFGQRNLRRRPANRAAVEIGVSTGKHQQSKPSGTNEIRQTDQAPVAQHLNSGDAAIGPGHGQQVVAGKELGSGHNHEQQAKRKHQTAQDRAGRKSQTGVRLDKNKQHRPQPDKGAGQHSQHEQRQR